MKVRFLFLVKIDSVYFLSLGEMCNIEYDIKKEDVLWRIPFLL